MAMPDNDNEEEIVLGEDEEEEEEVRPKPVRRNTKRRSDLGRAHEKSHASQWVNKDADLMWCEILEQMRKDGRQPYEIQIRVRDMSGLDVTSLMTTLDGPSVMGSDVQSPSDQLVEKVEQLHIDSGNQGNGRYQLDFCWKVGGQKYGSGIMNVKSPPVIMRMRHSKRLEQMGIKSDSPEAQSVPPQRQQMPWQGPYYPPPPFPSYAQSVQYGYPGYGAPQQQSSDPRLIQMQEELTREREARARVEGQLQEVIKAMQEGRAPNVVAPPVGIAAPPPSVDTTEQIVERVLTRVLPALGIGRPAQQTQATAEDQLTKAVREGMQTILQTTASQVLKGIQRSVTGIGSPIEDEDETQTAELVPPKPEDNLPFIPSSLEQKWADGRNVGVAMNKETGKIDWMGTAFQNPFIVEKVADVVNKVGEAFADAVKKAGAGGPHIVHRIPEEAKPANVTSHGEVGLGGSNWE